MRSWRRRRRHAFCDKEIGHVRCLGTSRSQTVGGIVPNGMLCGWRATTFTHVNTIETDVRRVCHTWVSIFWQAESDGTDTIHAAAAGSDGSFVLGGYTDGNWSGVNEGLDDYAALKFDADMGVVWELQVMNGASRR